MKQHEKGKIKQEISVDEDDDELFEREEIEINGKKILRKKIGKKGKKPPVSCEICGTISKGAFNNARHLYTMHGIKREVQCDKCDTLCESVRAMLEHKKNHHSSASCHLCGKVFVEKGHLENHLMRHGIGKDGNLLQDVHPQKLPCHSYEESCREEHQVHRLLKDVPLEFCAASSPDRGARHGAQGGCLHLRILWSAVPRQE